MARSVASHLARPATALENKGARYLTFQISGAPRTELSVHGYVPDYAKVGTPNPELHGWDVPTDTTVYADGKLLYDTAVVVDDRSATHYRFGVAEGRWSRVATAKADPTEFTDKVLARGPWGTLRQLAPPQRRSGNDVFDRSRPRYPAYRIDPPSEPPAMAYRLRLLGADGRDLGGAHRQLYFPGARSKKPTTITLEVHARPYEWLEFSGVHYDPDPKKWGDAHYGDEGNLKATSDQPTRLEGLIRPKYLGDHWQPVEVYAADGKTWRGHPRPNAVRPLFSGPPHPAPQLVAAFALDEHRVSALDPVWIEGFAADSATPGKGLREPLGPWPRYQAERPLAQMPITRPKNRPYVQFAVRYSGTKWVKVGSFKPPVVQFPGIPQDKREMYDTGSATWAMFSVILRPTGKVDMHFTQQNGGSELRTTGLTFSRGSEPRLYARLKNGTRVHLRPNAFGGEGSKHVDFSPDGSGEPTYGMNLGVAQRQSRIGIRDVVEFEVEARTAEPPIYLVAKLPAK